MPCPCNFKKNNNHIRYISNSAMPIDNKPISNKKSIISKKEALYNISKTNNLRKQIEMKKQENIIFTPLKKNSKFKVEKINGVNKINLDSSASYNENNIFKLKKGLYIITGVPPVHAFNLVKHDDNIQIHSKNKIGKDKLCYYGNIILVVRGDFDKNGIECCNHGYMGRKDLFYYVPN